MTLLVTSHFMSLGKLWEKFRQKTKKCVDKKKKKEKTYIIITLKYKEHLVEGACWITNTITYLRMNGKLSLCISMM